jgi:hypothetical protein
MYAERAYSDPNMLALGNFLENAGNANLAFESVKADVPKPST